MIDVLRDLWAHQAWADATLWRAILVCDAAQGDAFLRERTLHVHQAQEAFLGFALGEVIDYARTDGLTDLAAIREYGRQVLERGTALLAGTDATRVGRIVTPSFERAPPLRFTVGEGLLQAILHSQHHRGQNAMRLREIGGEPATTDLILWITAGRPAPDWS